MTTKRKEWVEMGKRKQGWGTFSPRIKSSPRLNAHRNSDASGSSCLRTIHGTSSGLKARIYEEQRSTTRTFFFLLFRICAYPALRNLSPIDRIHMAATEFRTGRIWPPGHTRVGYLWDQVDTQIFLHSKNRNSQLFTVPTLRRPPRLAPRLDPHRPSPTLRRRILLLLRG